MNDQKKTLGWTAVLFGLVLIGAGCHSGAGEALEFDEDSDVLVLAPLESGALRITDFAAWDQGSTSSVSQGTISSGVSSIPSAMQGGSGDAIVFKSTPATRSYWIDLDQPIGGTIFIGNGAAGVEAGEFRIDWFVDDDYGGGMTWIHNPQSSGTAWNPINIYFRPEVRMIPAGSTVEVHVTPVSGLADFKLGTGGDAASHLAFAYLKVDPLSGALFLEDGELVKSLSKNNDTEESESEGGGLSLDARDPASPDTATTSPSSNREKTGIGAIAVAAGLALPGFALVGLTGRIRGKHLLVAAMMVTLALSGCAKDDGAKFQDVDGADDAPKPTVNETYEDIPDEETPGTEVKEGVGIIRGTVVDQIGIPIEGAHISFIATNMFTRTKAEGTFEFLDVPIGDYTMRIDAEDFESLERSVKVQEAKITRLDVTMVPPSTVQGDDLAHVHDEWNGQMRKLVERTQPFEVPSEVYTQSQDAGVANICFPQYGASAGTNGQVSSHTCIWPIPLDLGSRIIPGTGTVEVRLEWDDSASNAPEFLGVAASHPHSSSEYNNMYQPRAPGEPTLMQIFPNAADPGHQQFSNWEFFVIAERADFLAPWTEPFWEIPEITAEIHVHKSIVPFEPAHEDKWGEMTRIQLTDPDEAVAYTCICTSDNNDAQADGWESYTYGWDLVDDAWVPPGTSHLEGTVIADYSYNANDLPAPPHIEYAIGYKPANIPAANVEGNLVVIDEITPTADGWTFSVTPQDKELDQWYQSKTQWEFYLLVKYEAGSPYWLGARFHLDVQAVKDPEWGTE